MHEDNQIQMERIPLSNKSAEFGAYWKDPICPKIHCCLSHIHKEKVIYGLQIDERLVKKGKTDHGSMGIRFFSRVLRIHHLST